MGLLEPSAGEIQVDGRPIASIGRSNWQAQIAHVPQAVYLSDDTVAANIAFGQPPEARHAERIRSAAAVAQIDGFIEALPRGYETLVGHRGIHLSGGQRQRIGIARSIYKGASILILDEATNALDDGTEAAVLDAIMSLPKSITIVMVAHRSSTLARCDRVIRLQDGSIAGDHPAPPVRVASSGR
jgi:ATP-binding cassette subfamily B protein